jgi:hypothetical protein
MAEQRSPGTPEFEDLPQTPVTISYVFLSIFLLINKFYDVAVTKLGR